MHALHGGASHVLALVASQKAQTGDHETGARFQKISSICGPGPGGSEQISMYIKQQKNHMKLVDSTSVYHKKKSHDITRYIHAL
jgi:hypothetical protein